MLTIFAKILTILNTKFWDCEIFAYTIVPTKQIIRH